MTGYEGENLLLTCLRKMDASCELSDILHYKTGNKKSASNYNGGTIPTKLKEDEIKMIDGNIPFVVKCFYHMEIYVAWHSEVGIGNGKYCVYQSSLKDFEDKQELSYNVMNTGTRDIDRVYFFRGQTGIKRFFTDAVGIQKKETP